MTPLDKFLDLLRESVIIQGVLTLAVVGVWLYLLAASLPITDGLNNIVGLVIGFYFGGKLQLAISKKNGGG